MSTPVLMGKTIYPVVMSTNTGVNTSKLNRLEHFIRDFETEGKNMSGEELHSYLDEIERIMAFIPR